MRSSDCWNNPPNPYDKTIKYASGKWGSIIVEYKIERSMQMWKFEKLCSLREEMEAVAGRNKAEEGVN